ncbi:MAG: hypothetical protein HYY02_13615 [Chloroflexi bacterium]|nr:hypothetical protein [Chloroflexota bacterium]
MLRQSLVANSLFLLTAVGVSNVGGFFFWLLAARFHSTEAVGQASALVSSAVLVSGLASLGLGFGFIQRYAVERPDAITAINTCMTVIFLLALALGGTYFIGLQWWSPALVPIPGGLLTVIFFLVITATGAMISLADFGFMAARRAGYVLGLNASHSTLRVGVLAATPALGVAGILTAVGVAYLLTLLLVLFIFLRGLWPDYRPRVSLRWPVVQPLLKFSLVNHVASLLWGVPGAVMPLLVINQFGATATAHFYIVWAMAALIWAAPMAVSQALFAEGSANAALLRAHLRQALLLGGGLVLAGAAAAFLVGEQFLSLYGRSYAEEGAALLQVLALVSFPMALVYGYLGVLRVRRRLVELCLLSGLVAFGGPALALVLASSWGLMGVATGYALAVTAAGALSAARIRWGNAV